MDIVERFPFVYCNTCKKVQPMIFDVLKAENVSDHEAADIVCDEECKPVIATLHVRRHRCPTSLAENTSVGCLADSRRTSQTLIRCSAAAAGSIAAISAKSSATNGTRTPIGFRKRRRAPPWPFVSITSRSLFL